MLDGSTDMVPKIWTTARRLDWDSLDQEPLILLCDDRGKAIQAILLNITFSLPPTHGGWLCLMRGPWRHLWELLWRMGPGIQDSSTRILLSWHPHRYHQVHATLWPLSMTCQYLASIVGTYYSSQFTLAIAPWEINILGSFPPASRQRKFLIVCINYLTKWMDVKLLARITENEACSFIWKSIIY